MGELETNELYIEHKVLENDKIKEFIEDRNIRLEDFYLIEQLAAFPKDSIILELHNMFNMNHERSSRELLGLIERSQDEERKKLFKLALEFNQKYDWGVSWNLVRVLEDL